jgi:hypothetical protein
MTDLNTLREQSHVATGGALPPPHTGGRTCEIVATLESVVERQGDSLKLRATALFEGPHTQAGHSDLYSVRPDRINACVDNLHKGVGSQPGSVLVFGGAWRNPTDGVVSVGWINTAISAQKVQARMNGHADRSVVELYAQMPVLEFPNTDRQPGEPRWIRWGLACDTAALTVDAGSGWQTLTFDRPWLVEKLRQAWEQRAQPDLKINLWLPTLRVDQAVAVTDPEAMIQETARFLRENAYRQVLARVSDGAEVATRFLPYRPPDASEPETWLRSVFAQAPGFDPNGHPVFDPATGEQVQVDRYSLMAGVSNAILFEYAARREVTVELLPRENLLLSTKNAPGMAHQVKQVLGATSNAELYAIRFAFGEDRDAVSRVAVVLQQQPDYRLAVAGPFRLDAGPAYTPASVPSAHITPPVHLASAASSTATPPGPARPDREALIEALDTDAAFDVDALIEQARREADASSQAEVPVETSALDETDASSAASPAPARRKNRKAPTPAPTPSMPTFPRPQL